MKLLKAIIGSKKFWYAISGVAVNLLVTMLDIDPALAKELHLILGGIVIALITGQGFADLGKEAEKEKKNK